MAQHLEIKEKELVGKRDEESKAIRKLIREVRNDLRTAREADAELGDEYIELPSDHLEGTETSGLVKHVDVPESMVYGGRASLELRFRMSVLSKIFLVA